MRKLIKTTQWFSVAHSLPGMLETGTEYVAMENSCEYSFHTKSDAMFYKNCKIFSIL